MKQVVVVLFLLASVAVTAQYGGNPRITSRSGKVFNNTDCAATNTCDLTQIRYLAEDYEILVGGGMNYGTRFFAHYTTDTVENLENYAFVQFIKGCKYYSHDTGEVFPKSVVHINFGEMSFFNYKDWTVESIDTDPIYFSTPQSRHFNYKWNTKRGSVSRNTERFYGIEKPSYPKLYITDIPGVAFHMNNNAKNTSLAFKLCLYRTSDVPRESTPENIDFAVPINCFYWYSSWVYDHDIGKFQHPYNIAPACNN
ncbi:MAG: hypothetical protein HYX22_01465 [Candidatus Yanofskybacteria bacterium]|nr:hypothetical protein [Candidatus Yanofskybacteria bacterium]